MTAEASSRAKVFISYARRDGAALAEELVTALEVLGFNGYLDRHDIAAGEDWERRLDTLIREADTVVFVLTPESVHSPRCAWEVRRAVELSKRVVPVVGEAVADAAVPSELQRLNYIYFTQGHSFSRSLGQLADTLRLDIDWIREHTRIGELAQRWLDRKQPEALLLRDEELAAAQSWASRWKAGAPPLTDLQRTYLAACVDAETRRADLERQRNEAMAQANAERADALSQQEHAVRMLKRRTVIAGLGVSGLSLGLGGLALWTLEVRRRAEKAERESFTRAVQVEAGRTDIIGQVVAYAASPGQMAIDSLDASGHSPYTAALLKELGAEHVSLWSALSKTSMEVSRKTNGQQRPFVSSDMNGDIYLRLPSKTRRLKAIVIGVGHYASIQGLSLKGVYRDVDAWAGFLRTNGFDVVLLRDPTRAAVLQAVDEFHIASDLTAAYFRRVGIKLKGAPIASKSTTQPNTLALVFYAGFGFLSGNERYLATTDTLVAAAGTGFEVGSAISVSALERHLRERAAASVVIYDTQFL
jgi:hypothetical protein